MAVVAAISINYSVSAINRKHASLCQLPTIIIIYITNLPRFIFLSVSLHRNSSALCQFGSGICKPMTIIGAFVINLLNPPSVHDRLNLRPLPLSLFFNRVPEHRAGFCNFWADLLDSAIRTMRMVKGQREILERGGKAFGRSLDDDDDIEVN